MGASIENVRRNNVKRRSYREERRNWKIQRQKKENDGIYGSKIRRKDVQKREWWRKRRSEDGGGRG